MDIGTAKLHFKDGLGKIHLSRMGEGVQPKKAKSSNIESETNHDKYFKLILSQIEELDKKLDYMVGVFKGYENKSENQGMVVYNSESKDKVLVERKGLFGKSKWVEEET